MNPKNLDPVQTTINAFIAEMARYNVHAQFRDSKVLPWHGAGKKHFEFRFLAHCDKPTLARLDLDKTIAGIKVVNREPRYDAEGEPDPTLGFVLTGQAAFDE